jgi:hypothetical protein
VVPLGLKKAFHFEFCVRALESTPELPMFCAFYKLTKAGDWLTFRKRNELLYHIGYVPSSLKQWKESFFHINAQIFLFMMSFRDIKEKFRDDPPKPITYNNTTYTYLHIHPTNLQAILEDALAAAGISRRWRFLGFRPPFRAGGKGKSFDYQLP